MVAGRFVIEGIADPLKSAGRGHGPSYLLSQRSALGPPFGAGTAHIVQFGFVVIPRQQGADGVAEDGQDDHCRTLEFRHVRTPCFWLLFAGGRCYELYLLRL